MYLSTSVLRTAQTHTHPRSRSKARDDKALCLNPWSIEKLHIFLFQQFVHLWPKCQSLGLPYHAWDLEALFLSKPRQTLPLSVKSYEIIWKFGTLLAIPEPPTVWSCDVSGDCWRLSFVMHCDFGGWDCSLYDAVLRANLGGWGCSELSQSAWVQPNFISLVLTACFLYGVTASSRPVLYLLRICHVISSLELIVCPISSKTLVWSALGFIECTFSSSSYRSSTKRCKWSMGFL